MRLPDAWRLLAGRLSSSTTPGLDAQLLIAHVLGCSRAALLAMDRVLTPHEQQAITTLIARREAGEPLAYLLGRQDFYQSTLLVDKRVLVPRPETELLVEQVLACPLPEDAHVLDVGTGSGAIAIALATMRPGWSLVASDIMPDALAVAQQNIDCYKLQEQIQCVIADIYTGVPTQRFHMVVSNPPYIAEDDPHMAALTHEPRAALVSAEGGYTHLRRLIEGASAVLLPHGYIALEHGYEQKAVLHTLLAHGGFIDIETYRDLSGLDRVTIARYNR
jgi:release factor glutamine methyltransferase